MTYREELHRDAELALDMLREAERTEALARKYREAYAQRYAAGKATYGPCEWTETIKAHKDKAHVD